MSRLAIVAVTLLAGAMPAMAEEGWWAWKHATLGYFALIPEAFEPLGPTTGNTGMAFSASPRQAQLIVFSGPLGGDGVRAELAVHRERLLAAGGSVNLEFTGEDEAWMIGTTPTGGVHTRVLSECGGTRHLTIVLSWAETERSAFAPMAVEIASRLEQVFCPSPG